VSALVHRTRKSLYDIALATGLCAVAVMLWLLHASAFELGGRSDILDFESSRTAVAAREWALRGRLATTFALPLELRTRPAPPWPLQMTPPGPVALEALLFRLTPVPLDAASLTFARLRRPDQRAWLTLVPPLLSFFALAAALALVTLRLLRRYAPELPRERRGLAGFVIGFMLLLDPETQLYAAGGFGELPFTLLLGAAFAMLALDVAPRRPLVFGLALGAAGLFRTEMAWLAPLLALAAAWLALPRGAASGRSPMRVLALVLLGFALPLTPWWIYQWRQLGSPAADLGRLAMWVGVEGQSWFSLYHLPQAPSFPTGMAAASEMLAKVGHNLPPLLLALLKVPRALWLGALVIWVMGMGERRPLRAAGLAVLAALVVGVLGAALGVPSLRGVYPGRVLAEAAGLLALWNLIALIPGASVTSRRLIVIAVSVLALGSGLSRTLVTNRGAERAAAQQTIPGPVTMLQIEALLQREGAPAGEPVMCNLGPAFAWHARRPVIDLAATPDDIDACRRLLDFRHVLLVFKDREHAWTGWEDLFSNPAQASRYPDWNIVRARTWRTGDGFKFVWLELGPLRPRLASSEHRHPA
jgi:hypothetical protein